MARRSGLGDLVYFGAVGGLLYAGYKLALTGGLGPDLQKLARDIRAQVDASTLPPIPTTLRDLGGQIVGYRVSDGVLVQVGPGTNVYRIGDVFVNEDGAQWQLVAPFQVRNTATGQTVDVKAFALAM